MQEEFIKSLDHTHTHTPHRLPAESRCCPHLWPGWWEGAGQQAGCVSPSGLYRGRREEDSLASAPCKGLSGLLRPTPWPHPTPPHGPGSLHQATLRSTLTSPCPSHLQTPTAMMWPGGQVGTPAVLTVEATAGKPAPHGADSTDGETDSKHISKARRGEKEKGGSVRDSHL